MSNTNTSLHIAVQNDNIDIVKMLLEAGHSPNEADADGLTPLDLAIATNNTEIVQLLVAYEEKALTTFASVQPAAPHSNAPIAGIFEHIPFREKHPDETLNDYCDRCGKAFDFWYKTQVYSFFAMLAAIGAWAVSYLFLVPADTLPPIWLSLVAVFLVALFIRSCAGRSTAMNRWDAAIAALNKENEELQRRHLEERLRTLERQTR